MSDGYLCCEEGESRPDITGVFAGMQGKGSCVRRDDGLFLLWLVE